MSSPDFPAGSEPAPRDPHYKWVALSNTTLGMLAAAVNGIARDDAAEDV